MNTEALVFGRGGEQNQQIRVYYGNCAEKCYMSFEFAQSLGLLDTKEGGSVELDNSNVCTHDFMDGRNYLIRGVKFQLTGEQVQFPAKPTLHVRSGARGSHDCH